MPTSGTHITVVEQLALRDPQMAALLGDPTADPDTPAGTQMRFAKLGAVGPDLLYFLGDFNRVPATPLQDLENFLVKVGGTESCLSDLSEKVGKYLDGELDKITDGIASELKQTTTLISGIISDALLNLLVDAGVNIWALFDSPRQEDLPPDHWFWADYLHYVHTGDFVKRLLYNAKSKGNPNLYAYALGYLTHYVTDVVGHPYVNQVVQGPYRMHWQRHHVVENFMDAYTWDRWHVQLPDPGGAEERPLDAPTPAPNAMSKGAPVLMSRLHDHITVGKTTLGDPVDAIVEAVCSKIEKGLFDIGVLEKTDMDEPDDKDFKECLGMLAATIQDVWPAGSVHPIILAGAPDPRPGGYPLPDDLAGAYGVLRLLLKISTESDIKEPVFPDIVGDVTQAIEDAMNNIAKDLGGIPPFPTPNTSGSFSWDSLMHALADIAQWAGEVAGALGKAIADAVGVGEVIVTDSIKVLLWLLNKALFAAYRYFRDVLVLNGYGSPFTDELVGPIGSVRAEDLWISKGNLPKNQYPVEENLKSEAYVFSSYHPYVPPAAVTPPLGVENPPVNYAGPYGAGSRPEAFLEAPLGPDNMFSSSSVQAPTPPGTSADQTFTDTPKNFGGAIANSQKAIATYEKIGGDLILPNFDMDGDRGYAWPGWQTSNKLNPNHVTTPPGVHVNAVPS